jgi:hypothetical protein
MESRQQKIVNLVRKWGSADGLVPHEPFYPYIMGTKDLRDLLDLYSVADLSDEQQATWVRLLETWGRGLAK